MPWLWPSRHQPRPCRLRRFMSLWVPSRKSAKAAVPLGYELVASACPEPASVRPAGTSAGVLDGVEAFAFRTTKGSSILASIHLVAQPPSAYLCCPTGSFIRSPSSSRKPETQTPCPSRHLLCNQLQTAARLAALGSAVETSTEAIPL